MIRALLMCSVLFGGCAKANDLGRLQDEAIQIAQSYKPTVEELRVRANAIAKRGRLGPEAAALLTAAQTQISALTRKIDGTKPEVSRGSDDLTVQKLSDNTEDQLREGIVEASSKLEEVETWVSVTERRQPFGSMY